MPTKKPPPYKAGLESLTAAVMQFIKEFDVLMNTPSTPERGQRLAQLCNALEMFNDRIRYTILGVDFRTDKKTRSLGTTPLSSPPK